MATGALSTAAKKLLKAATRDAQQHRMKYVEIKQESSRLRGETLGTLIYVAFVLPRLPLSMLMSIWQVLTMHAAGSEEPCVIMQPREELSEACTVRC